MKLSVRGSMRLRYLLAFALLASLLVSGQVVIWHTAEQFSTTAFLGEFRNTDDDGNLTVGDVVRVYDGLTMPKVQSLHDTMAVLLVAALVVLAAEAFFIFEPLIGTIRRQVHDLEAARDEACAANRIKSEFLANMSHEIRTPMNGVLGLTELMLQTAIDSQQREYLGLVRQSARSLLTLLNDILDLSKIEAGRLDLETTEFDLAECVEGAVRLLALAASEKGLRLEQRVSRGISPRLLGDPNRLRQVMVNLIGNAVKFTPRGQVVVGVEQAWRRDLATELHFSVRDTGIGIPPDKLGLVFEAFRQADSSTSRRFGGTGLGLSICQQLVQMMGGRIWVESEMRAGTVFHFTVTLGIAPRASLSELKPHAALLGAPVLVLIDNHDERQAQMEALRQLSLRPTSAEGSAAAAELRRAVHVGQPYRLVVGDEAVKVVESDVFTEDLGEAVPPVIAIASHATDETPATQAAWRLTRPVEPWLLLQAIETVLGSAAPAAVSAPLPSRGANERVTPRQVLLVEDGLINQTVAVGLLKRRGHVVAVANHGREALDALARQPFDVVLMDVQMPVMDGLEATRAIREQEITTGRRQRVVAMTAGATSEERTACLVAGMDDFLVKPVDPLELYRLVESAPALAAASSTE